MPRAPLPIPFCAFPSFRHPMTLRHRIMAPLKKVLVPPAGPDRSGGILRGGCPGPAPLSGPSFSTANHAPLPAEGGTIAAAARHACQRDFPFPRTMVYSVTRVQNAANPRRLPHRGPRALRDEDRLAFPMDHPDSGGLNTRAGGGE